MGCQLFSFAQECDIPNWFSLIIEVILGLIITISFFIHQKYKSDSRARTATKRIIVHLIDLKKSQEHLKKSINDYYEKTIDKNKLIHSLEGIKHSSESLEMMLVLYANSINEEVLSKIEFLCGFIRIMKLSGEKQEFDLVLCSVIEDKWDDCMKRFEDLDPKTYEKTIEGKAQYDATKNEEIKKLIKEHSGNGNEHASDDD